MASVGHSSADSDPDRSYDDGTKQNLSISAKSRSRVSF